MHRKKKKTSRDKQIINAAVVEHRKVPKSGGAAELPAEPLPEIEKRSKGKFQNKFKSRARQ
jgi:hypothetical protein